MDKPENQTTIEQLQSMWRAFGFPPNGLSMPDVQALDKKIDELKTVESWLRMNLHMLQSTIQAMEAQRNALAAMQASPGDAVQAAAANPFLNPALWPWQLLQGMQAPSGAPDTEKK